MLEAVPPYRNIVGSPAVEDQKERQRKEVAGGKQASTHKKAHLIALEIFP